jgi:two-component system, NtrC family, sensor kinase
MPQVKIQSANCRQHYLHIGLAPCETRRDTARNFLALRVECARSQRPNGKDHLLRCLEMDHKDIRNRIRPEGLQSKFLVGVAFILLCFSFFIATLIYVLEKRALERGVFNQTEVVMAAAEATRQYVREVLRPKMYEVLDQDGFVLEAMSSSYVSRAIMDNFRETLPDFEYRRVAVNAKNPAFEANEFEEQLIRYFQEHPQEGKWQGIVTQNGRPYFMQAQPVTFVEACMRCHGKAEQAPQPVLDLYGAQRGFFASHEEALGLTSVAIPMELGLLKVKEMAWSVFGATFLVAFLLFGAIYIFFNKVVGQNLRGLLAIFRSTLRDEAGQTFYEQARNTDEIRELTTVAEVMAGHLQSSRKKLEEHAQDLEERVAERTVALRESEARLQAKVTARNKELYTLNTIAELTTQSVNLADILPKVLQQTLQLIPARGAACYLYRHEPQVLELQHQYNAPGLPSRLTPDSLSIPDPGSDFTASMGEAACGYMSFYNGQEEEIDGLNIPLCCRDRVLGVITFVGVDFKEINGETQELLFSIGRQIGVTIESLQNLTSLLRSKELLQTVFDGITDQVALLDGECRIKMVNRAFLNRYSRRFSEVLNQYCRDLPGAPCPFAGCGDLKDSGLRQAVTREKELTSGEIFEVHFYPIFGETGELQNIVCYGKDITAQKRLTIQTQQTEKMAAIGQLAAGVAHEINNPLGVILCYADLLKQSHGERQEELSDLQTIEKHALNCKRIVADLLNFARSRDQVRSLASVNQIIEETVNLVAAQFQKQQIGIETDLDPELPVLEIDADRLKQVFLNLFMNAAQAITGPGRIRISSHLQEEDRMAVVVEDNGCGIPPDQLDRIFDPFFTTKGPGEGTGLGLSVSYGIICDHGGEIRAESSPGEWTRLSVLLPVRQPLRSE